MWKDPIVEEIRAQRQAHAALFDYDVTAICRDLRRQQANSNRTIIRLPARRVQPTELANRMPGEAAQLTES